MTERSRSQTGKKSYGLACSVRKWLFLSDVPRMVFTRSLCLPFNICAPVASPYYFGQVNCANKHFNEVTWGHHSLCYLVFLGVCTILYIGKKSYYKELLSRDSLPYQGRCSRFSYQRRCHTSQKASKFNCKHW